MVPWGAHRRARCLRFSTSAASRSACRCLRRVALSGGSAGGAATAGDPPAAAKGMRPTPLAMLPSAAPSEVPFGTASASCPSTPLALAPFLSYGGPRMLLDHAGCSNEDIKESTARQN